MGRPLRIQYPGAWYHVTSRGNERKAIFKGKGDQERFLSYLQSAYERYGAIIHVYCLMSNHYHLLLETPRSNLSQSFIISMALTQTTITQRGDALGTYFRGGIRL